MRTIVLSAAALSLIASIPASAATTTYFSTLGSLNNSGVEGAATIFFNDVTQKFTVNIVADGLEPGQVHPQHIHGRFSNAGEDADGVPIDSEAPPPFAADDDPGGDDRLISISEGFPFYGPVIVPLDPFPVGDPDSPVFFSETYDINSENVFADDFGVDDLTPLIFREIVLHGMFVDGQYVATLPVAAGGLNLFEELPGGLPATLLRDGTGSPSPIPLPAAGWLLISGLGALAGYGRLRRKG